MTWGPVKYNYLQINLQFFLLCWYIFSDNNATLEIRKAVYTKDTGAYKCKARNPAGVGQDIATVFIENSKVPQYTPGKPHQYVVSLVTCIYDP